MPILNILPLGPSAGLVSASALYQLHFFQFLFFVAVVAADDAGLAVDVEVGVHRLVVGDALRVVAFYDAAKLRRGFDGLLSTTS